MFSVKELTETSYTFGAVENTKSGKVEEVLYFTNKTRDQKIKEEKDFLGDYTTNDSTQERIKLKDGFRFKILPLSEPVTGHERDTIFCAGQAGSGKTWQISQYILNYHLFHPDNDIKIVSINNIQNDPSLEEVVKLSRTVGFDEKTGLPITVPVVQQINLLSVESVIDHNTLENCLWVFDDVIDIKPSFSSEQIISMLTPAEREKYNKTGANLREQTAIQNAVLRRMKHSTIFIKESIRTLIDAGRKRRISVIVVDHALATGPYTSDLIKKCQSFWLFPYNNNSKKSLKTWLEKISFDKDEAEAVATIDFYQFDFLMLSKAGRKFAMTPDQLLLF
jgi:hypothetical protein